MLAMDVNDDAGSLTPRGALRFFASMLAPTAKNDNALHQMHRSAWFAGKMISRRSLSSSSRHPPRRP